VYKSPGFTLPSLVSGKMTSPRSSRTSKNFTVAFIFELTSSRCSNACSLRSAVKHNGFGSCLWRKLREPAATTVPTLLGTGSRYAPPPTTTVPATMPAVISGGLEAHVWRSCGDRFQGQGRQ
jgi:hypothetical protein